MSACIFFRLSFLDGRLLMLRRLLSQRADAMLACVCVNSLHMSPMLACECVFYVLLLGIGVVFQTNVTAGVNYLHRPRVRFQS